MHRSYPHGMQSKRGGRRPYMPFFVDDWRAGTRGLSLEARGFYLEFLLAQWDRGSALPDDDREIAVTLGCNPRTVRKLLRHLIDAGKLMCADGWVWNERVRSESADHRSDDQGADPTYHKPVQTEFEPNSNRIRAEFELNSSRKSPKTQQNQRRQNDVTISISKTTHTDRSPRSGVSADDAQKGGSTDEKTNWCAEALTAFQEWNTLALRCGLPQAAKLTPDRQRRLIARLKDYRLEGWRQALAHIERSSFLTGGGERGWKATLDFLLQPASFGKVHDGGYGNGRHSGGVGAADVIARMAGADEFDQALQGGGQ